MTKIIIVVAIVVAVLFAILMVINVAKKGDVQSYKALIVKFDAISVFIVSLIISIVVVRIDDGKVAMKDVIGTTSALMGGIFFFIEIFRKNKDKDDS